MGQKGGENNREKRKRLIAVEAENIDFLSYAHLAIQDLASAFLCKLSLVPTIYVHMYIKALAQTHTHSHNTTELSHAEHVLACQARHALSHLQVFEITIPLLGAHSPTTSSRG